MILESMQLGLCVLGLIVAAGCVAIATDDRKDVGTRTKMILAAPLWAPLGFVSLVAGFCTLFKLMETIAKAVFGL